MKIMLELAKKTLKKGGLVIFPTETVYGLGGDATNNIALKKIFKLKKRPRNNPLICHFKNITDIRITKTNPINEPMATKNINIGRSISTFGLDCQDSTVQANHIEPRDPHKMRIQFCLVIFGLYLDRIYSVPFNISLLNSGNKISK